MAKRPVFISSNQGANLVEIVNIEFEWFPGMAISQKKKSIKSLHSELHKIRDVKILEISSKSQEKLGVSMSAFNLGYLSPSGNFYSVESLFQGSKKFQSIGPFKNLYNMKSADARKYIKNLSVKSGNLVSFVYKEEEWELNPKTAFYDWLYMNMLVLNNQYHTNLLKYQAFTDIEFNPSKSINCQAFSAALFVSLHHRGLLSVIETKKSFLQFLKSDLYNILESTTSGQISSSYI